MPSTCKILLTDIYFLSYVSAMKGSTVPLTEAILDLSTLTKNFNP